MGDTETGSQLLRELVGGAAFPSQDDARRRLAALEDGAGKP
jgi:hypothetical protein